MSETEEVTKTVITKTTTTTVIINPNVISKKIAIKYNPPTLGFIFLHKKNKKNYLLEINLQEQLETELEPINICNWIYATYGDVVNLKTYPQEQIVRMINKIINHN
jgi:hypothetical protein